MPRLVKHVQPLVAAVALLLGPVGSVFGGLILTPTGSFEIPILPFFPGSLAADSDTIYVTFVHLAQISKYTPDGTFLGTVPLTGGPTTLFGGIDGATVTDSGDLILTSIYNSERELRDLHIYEERGLH